MPHEERRADADGRISHIEDGPDPQIKEIDDIAEPHAVDEIPHRTAQHERASPHDRAGGGMLRQQFPPHPRDDRNGEEDEDRLLALEEAERRTRVLHIGQVDDGGDERQAVARRKGASDERLGELIGSDDDPRNQPRPHPSTN